MRATNRTWKILGALFACVQGVADAQSNVASQASQKPIFIQIPPQWSQEHSGRPGTLSRLSPNSYVFRVRSGDVWLREMPTNPTERSEISQRSRWTIGSDVWFAFDMKILSGLPSQAAWVGVGQLHQTSNVGDGRGSPPWAQVIYPGRRFTVQIRHSAEMPLRHNPKPVILFTDPSISQGRVYSFVYRLRYDSVQGALDAWRNGNKIVTYRGPLGYPGIVGPYLKFGIYRAPAAGELAVFFGRIRTGVSACEVVNNPRRLPDLPERAADCRR